MNKYYKNKWLHVLTTVSLLVSAPGYCVVHVLLWLRKAQVVCSNKESAVWCEHTHTPQLAVSFLVLHS